MIKQSIQPRQREEKERNMAIRKKLEMIYYNGQPDGIRSIRRY